MIAKLEWYAQQNIELLQLQNESTTAKIVSEYGQEIPQSQTANKPVAP